MDWQTSGTTMAMIQQVIVDGANGVTQAPRLVTFIPWWQWAIALIVLTVGVLARTRVTLRAWLLVVGAIAYVPGYLQVFVMRADAPASQARLESTVKAVQSAFVARARQALVDLPADACYEVVHDESCVPLWALHDGMATSLRRARQCPAADAHRLRLAVRDCSLADLTVELLR
jgi:hypothetical protein